MNFQQRVLSALVIAPLVLLAVYAGGWVFGLFITLIVALGLREWLRLVAPDAPLRVLVFAHGALLFSMATGIFLTPQLGGMVAAFLTLVLFLFAARDHEETSLRVAVGIPYMAGSGLALLYLRVTPVIGMGLLYYLLAVVWSTDSGAYIAGRMVGGPKLAPTISPNKTWAGLLGGMALAAILGYGVALGFGANLPSVGLGLALLLAGVAQLGDLFKSHFKRRAGVKESGSLIPGHGGVLDRIDGLVFAAAFFVMFQVALGASLQWW